jgi:hypothetical protein
MGNFQDLTNKKFTKITVIKRLPNKNKKVMWYCRCDCGNFLETNSWHLTKGITKHCGCIKTNLKYDLIEHKGEKIPTTSHPLYPTYNGIKNRCYNKNLPTYNRWGGRGIKMSKSWYNSFHQFVQDMGEKPGPLYSIERKDNNKGYSKKNCCWATPKEQNNNKKSNIKIEYNGKILTLSQIAELKQINYSTLYHYFVVKKITDIDLIINFLKHKKTKKVNPKELKKIRQALHLIQKSMCPILKKKFPTENMVVDHLHKKHANLLNLPNAGCIRGVIHRQANSFEGKIANLMIRYGLHKFDISLPQLLKNTADYLEQPVYPYLHPSEKPKSKKLSKRFFKKLQKEYKRKYPKKKEIEYPKSGKLTKGIQQICDEFCIEPEYLKRK